MNYPYKDIPITLKQHDNWVVWGIRGSNQGASMKLPYNPSSLLKCNPQLAKAGVCESWGDYTDALKCVNVGLAQGLGYQFNNNGLYGVDLDNVFDENGTLIEEAKEIVEMLNSYTELSPSKRGLHVLVYAPDAVITRHRKKDHFLEIYGSGRYFTMTGNTFENRKTIETRSVELQEIHDKYMLPDKAQQTISIAIPSAEQSTDKKRFLEIGLMRDKVFNALWSGERRHGNESADDIALMNKLAYWTNADTATMIRAFILSPYYEQKDEPHKKKCQRSDYLTNTAKNSCSTVRSTAIADYERWQRNRNEPVSVR